MTKMKRGRKVAAHRKASEEERGAALKFDRDLERDLSRLPVEGGYRRLPVRYDDR